MSTLSLQTKSSRYVAGGVSETGDVGVEWWERGVISQDVSDIIYTVEKIYEGRIDLLSSAFFNNSAYWWVIAQLNNIIDPMTEIIEGRVLVIPTTERLTFILGNNMGGKPSSRTPINLISPIIM